jgi:hypothetical protein
MKQSSLVPVDHTAIKAGQAMTMLLLLAAFISDSWQLAAVVAVINILGAFVPSLSLFRLIYQHMLEPSGLLKPQTVAEYQAPHRFTQGFSGSVTALSAVLVAASFPLGWAFNWLVIVLANLNIFLGFCAGCFTYYQLSRLGIPGFVRQPLTSREQTQ